MSAPTTPADLLDLKLMPAWVNEPARTNDYADYKGEDERSYDRGGRGRQQERDSRPRPPKSREQRDRGKRPEQQRRPEQPERSFEAERPREAEVPLPQVAVRFIPHAAAFESVIAQIKSGTITYSVFALARMFLDKPERYDVHLSAPAEMPLFQLGENGAVAADARILEGSAFATVKDDFYNVEVTQSEQIKGNFSNVARDRSSGTLLGPTNHHSYQPQLRALYEQRYSRRMSFADFQRQIEIVSDPTVVEAWKEQARSVTVYTTKSVEPPVTFTSLSEAERHFRQTHLTTLIRTAPELTISGVLSRRLPDRGLGRVIEDAWAAEIRSPSKMMQELASGLRPAGLNIFRHRKGMLFVSPIRIRSFNHESTGVSASINSILTTVSAAPGMNRKQLAEKLVSGVVEPAESDKVKLSLASDLRWLITEGYLIEFNDGSLDLPRAKPASQEKHVGLSQGAAAPPISAPSEAATDAPSATQDMTEPALQATRGPLTDRLSEEDRPEGSRAEPTAETIAAGSAETSECAPAISEESVAREATETPNSQRAIEGA
ncbi:MAG: hypothetical protein H0U88_00960 [Chthoniobacterales bacterium]|nr:hypothetical protein [Chthoniobacterales bacterium]